MALVEGAALAVLACEANSNAIAQQRPERQRFGHAIVHRSFSVSHLRALLQQPLDLGMDVEALRNPRQRIGNLAQFRRVESGIDFVFRHPAPAGELRPVFRQGAHGGLLFQFARVLLGGFEFGPDFFVDSRSRGRIGANALAVKLPQRWMVLDLAIEQRLGDGGIVHLAVAVAAIADQVDHHVAVKAIAIFERQRAHAHHRLGIFAVDVEDGDRLPLRQVGGKARRVQLRRTGGEADQVVGEDVDRSADRKAFDASEVERLSRDALAGKSGVAVDHDGQNQFLAVGAGAHLLGARAAHGHRVHGFEMAGIRHQVDVNSAPVACEVVTGSADVVLHVAATQDAARVDIFEAGEDLLCWAVDNVSHHVQPPAMAHGQHRPLRVVLSRAFQNLVQHGNQRGHAFQRKALGTQVSRLQHLLEDLGAQQPLQDALAVRRAGRAFQLLLDPAPPLPVGQMHELRPDRPAVVAAGLLGVRTVEVEFRVRLGCEEPERIEIGLQVSPAAEQVEDLLFFESGSVDRHSF